MVIGECVKKIDELRVAAVLIHEPRHVVDPAPAARFAH
jgi:hypothetical protein